MSQHPLHLVWLRRDLRLHDNASISAALLAQGQVQPVFVFDTEILARFTHPHDRRLSFIARQISAMHHVLAQRGGGMLVLHGKAREIMPTLCDALHAAALHAARDAEPETRKRDKAVYEALKGRTSMVGMWDHLLLPPDTVMKPDGQPFRIFTPYYKVWRRKLTSAYIAERNVEATGRYADYAALAERAVQAGLRVLDASNPAAMLEAVRYRLVAEPLWDVGQGAARLESFAASHLPDYPIQRDMMGSAGTSSLSPYLRFGLISVRECASLAWGQEGFEKWLAELAWRDFYAMTLYHFPQVVTQEYQERFQGIEWQHHPEWFARWQEGMTGYPVVDAAMRQLLQEGWIHNRARMIAASFLTKDLLIDWRLGEEHFAQYLMDYDLASNNGGWQWAASTGTDAQPWFRIFNPTLQAKKFDAQGAYVRRYVPELAHLSAPTIHEPWKHGGVPNYPAPIVEHHAARLKALALFKAVRG